jgi:hypothetical protein
VAHKRDNGEVLLVRSSLERMKEAFNPASVETLFHTCPADHRDRGVGRR